ncbi:hypothetical protein [Novosphingobium album (ex Liu et al. 2023)]|uniref:XRE family transcriptional regulator n=1 Tax=Novosphingobium album (ex Liu et al. 2023) TaxID=3031130 RepID=A0ABT5WYD3_9SPHN|nr:hypothetical protein [Novosphingobium album (ex Liu et al. 2023)]MDE8654796.1 hypothetical protein [Novosphingobium album (ex Liu et al. 2023)]
MTKHRPPLTFEAALARVVGQLPGDWAEAAQVCGRAASTVRNWGNPDLPEGVPVECALALDLAFQGAGGLGAPFYEAYTVQLELAATDRFAGPAALLQLLPEVLRENSEAEIALVAAARNGAGRHDLKATLREIDEAMARFRQAHQLIQSCLGGAGDPATAPEPHATGPPPPDP